MVRSATNPDSVLDTAIGIAARPAPGVELGANDVAVPGNVLAAIGAEPGDVAHVSSESAGVWARLRASREVDHPDGGAFVLRLGRMLWPQLGVKPGQPLSIGRAGALPVATELRLTPPFNLTFKTHERMLDPPARGPHAAVPGHAGAGGRVLRRRRDDRPGRQRDPLARHPRRGHRGRAAQGRPCGVRAPDRTGRRRWHGADHQAAPRAGRAAAAAAGLLPPARRAPAEGRPPLRAARDRQDPHLPRAGQRARRQRVQDGRRRSWSATSRARRRPTSGCSSRVPSPMRRRSC